MNVSIKRLFIISLILLYSQVSLGRLRLRVNVIHKLGIDKNLVLKSELHNIKELMGRDYILVRMKNGIEVKLFAKYIDTANTIGPSDKIQLRAELYDQNGHRIKEFSGEQAQVSLWSSVKFIYSNNIGQEVEINVLPEPN